MMQTDDRSAIAAQRPKTLGRRRALMSWMILDLALVAVLLAGCATPAVERGGANTAKWHGNWRSTVFPTIEGFLEADLPLPLPPDCMIVVPVTLTYADDSRLRPGMSFAADFELTVGEAASASGGGHHKHDASTASISFKGSPIAGQTITFSAALALSGEELSGEYQSIDPMDFGSFELRR